MVFLSTSILIVFILMCICILYTCWTFIGNRNTHHCIRQQILKSLLASLIPFSFKGNFYLLNIDSLWYLQYASYGMIQDNIIITGNFVGITLEISWLHCHSNKLILQTFLKCYNYRGIETDTKLKIIIGSAHATATNSLIQVWKRYIRWNLMDTMHRALQNCHLYGSI